MKLEEIQQAIRATPFTPFTLVGADGAEVAVTHPENITLSAASAYVVVWNTDHTDSVTHILRLTLISRLVVKERREA